MPPKFIIKKKPTETKDPVEALSGETLASFKAIFEQAEDELVERGEEISAAKLCIATGSHMLLNGLHGIAKSMLADNIFGRIEDAAVFKKMFMASTNADEIFGPMNSKRYREDAIWEHNIAGHLPTAHFFYGDEIYRASDHMLPAMMNILNEREFINGTHRLHCPLITAMGTTNFMKETDELAAFNDRWHVIVTVQPLSAESSVMKMLSRYLRGTSDKKRATVTLADVQTIRKAVKAVKIPKELLEIYTKIMHEIPRAGNSPIKYISDRRKCIGLRFIQASALLNERYEADADDLAAARYAAITVRDNKQEQIWSSLYGTHVSDYQKFQTETKELGIIENWFSQREAEFDDNMPKSRAEALYEQCKKCLSGLQNMPSAKQPTTRAGIERKDNLIDRVTNLLNSVKDLLD